METATLSDTKFRLLFSLERYTNNFLDSDLLENFLRSIGVLSVAEMLEKFSDGELGEIDAFLNLKIKINGKVRKNNTNGLA